MTNSMNFTAVSMCTQCILADICMDIVCICKISRVVLECCHFKWKHRKNQSRRFSLVCCAPSEEWVICLWTVTVSYDLSYYRKLFICRIFHSLASHLVYVDICKCVLVWRSRRIETWTNLSFVIWEGVKKRRFSKNWPKILHLFV